MSNSRLEKFIYAICSMEVSDLPAPLSRIEILWNCLITGETPDFEPQSRNEQYLMAMLGLYELENLPTPMSRGEKLLYKIAVGETDLSDIPAYLSRYEELLGYLAENGGVGDFEYILQTLNQRLSTLYSTKERPMKQAVIKGDTLVNELPKPSLKNTMTNAASQKLNQGYDNGKTLVNLLTDFTPNLKYNDAQYRIILNGVGYFNKITIVNKNSKPIRFSYYSNTWSHNEVPANGNILVDIPEGLTTYNIFPLDTFGWESSNYKSATDSIVLLHGDYTNQDIPYFEGTKTFSATPNVVDGEFKQAVVKGQTLLADELGNECEIPNSPKVIMGAWIDTTSGVENASPTSFNTRFLKCPTVPFIIKGNNKYKRIIFYDKEKKYISGINSGIENNSNFVINSIPSNVFCIRISASIVTDNNTSYTPDTKLLIEDTNGNSLYITQLQSVQLSEVTTTGKNLFDVSKETKNVTIDLDSGLANVYTNDRNTSDFIKVTPNTKYISNVKMTRIGYYDRDKNFITSVTNVSDGITIPSLGIYVRFSYINTLSNVQFKQGSVATPYEPYQSNTLTLAEPVNLRKVGEVEDEFDALTGQVTERIGEIVLDGSDDETWNTDITKPNNYRFLIELPNINVNGNTGIVTEIVISDKFPSINNADSDVGGKDVESVCINKWANGKLNLAISKTKLTDRSVNSLREYLSQNPFTVQYQLKMPITKTITTAITNQDNQPQTKLHSFNDGYLSVSSQGVFPSAVNYEVPTNNSYYLPDMLTLGAQYTSRGSAASNATIDGKLLSLGANKTFTTPSSVTDKLMVLDAPVDDLMFIKGDQTAKDFGYFEGMKSVGLSNKMPVLTTTGKNLFDGIIELGGINSNTGLDTTWSGSFRTSFMRVPKNNTNFLFTFNCKGLQMSGGYLVIIYYNENKERISSYSVANQQPFNFNQDAYYYRITQNVDDTLNISDITNIQLEKGTIATAYEPHKSNILTVNEPVELRGIGNVQDTLDLITGEVTQRIDEYSFNGSENWLKRNDGDGVNTISFHIDLPKTNANTNNFINNIFNFSGSSSSGVEGCAFSGTLLMVQINRSRLDTVDLEGFRKWLQTSNFKVQVPLKEKVVKTVDLTTVDQDGQPTKLKTFDDITHVEMNADSIIPTVEVEVATKISETLATLDPQQLNISETQNKLSQTIDEQNENTDATMMATTEIYENL